jgi:hypothetical protein
MKNIVILALWVMVSPIMAQKDIEKTIGFSGKQSIEMNIQIADSINIETWNRPEIQVSASINLNDNEDNDAYETSFNETGNKVVIKANIKKEYFKEHNCCCKGMIIWKVMIPENTPINVETIDGNITVKGKTTEISAKSISGFIDWEVTPGRKADLEMKTISGTMYSDMALSNQNGTNGIPQVISENLNGGGIPVTLETISGDIFCRKSK